MRSRRLEQGKVPSELLRAFLGRFAKPDASILIGPEVGEDSAAIETDDECIVVTSDPITFTTENIGRYAVTINANDIATTGGRPRWFFTTVLIPTGYDADRMNRILDDISGACGESDITLCGGHTEVTDAVIRPVVSGTMIGTVSKGRLVDKRSMKIGDVLLITKGIAVEGTAILANDSRTRLIELGVDAAIIEAARGLTDRIGIRLEAEIACGTAPGAVSALHDVTEGGIATAVEELGRFARIAVDVEAVPVLPETRSVCSALEIDPLGLIGSGSLLIACRPDSANALLERIARAGIACSRLGSVVGDASTIGNERGVEWRRGTSVIPAPYFAVDELARYYAAISRTSAGSGA